jgi:hypothetical protein
MATQRKEIVMHADAVDMEQFLPEMDEPGFHGVPWLAVRSGQAGTASGSGTAFKAWRSILP